jgi:2,3-bisphosphoglycerate-independent phosphoglycerate mutase
MKYIILVPDGVADEPVAEFGGKTPLEAAKTPNMDIMTREGFCAQVRIIPPGMPPGSDIGNISVLGYDPSKGFSGRSPLEAANIGIILRDNELAFRCNLVTINDNTMIDYSAGHISIDEAAVIMVDIARELSDDTVAFHTGKSYRHITVIKTDTLAEFMQTRCTPPHDILGQGINAHLPKGPKSGFLSAYAAKAAAILKDHPVNKARIARGELPANAVWFWGQGKKPSLQLFKDRYGMTGSIISAVDLVNGIGRLIGLDVINVPGATGYYDTNFKGKAEYGLASLTQHDFVYIHVEATDEAGHNGDFNAKVKSIENFDHYIVGPAIDYLKAYPDTRILVTPDHPTPVARRTHTNAPVPFVMMGKNIERNGLDRYNERSAVSTGTCLDSGERMVELFMAKEWKQ